MNEPKNPSKVRVEPFKTTKVIDDREIELELFRAFYFGETETFQSRKDANAWIREMRKKNKVNKLVNICKQFKEKLDALDRNLVIEEHENDLSDLELSIKNIIAPIEETETE